MVRPSVPRVGRPTATASPRSLEATRRVPHPGRRQTVGQGAVGPADDRETPSTQGSQPCPGRLHRVRRLFRGGEGHLLCTTAPFLKGGIHKRVAKPPKAEGERLCRSCYALAHPTMPRRSTRSANWLEAAMLPATGSPEPASSL